MYKKQFDKMILPHETENLIHSSIDNILNHQSDNLVNYYYTDALTGLANRSQLTKDIKDIVDSSLLLIDIDGFRDIVYYYGHEISDVCLKSFSSKLKQTLYTDNYKHYRISGDIFAVLVKNCRGIDELDSLMKKLIEDSNLSSIDCNEHEINLRISIGASLFREKLLISAEKALKTAKKENKTMLIYNETCEENLPYEQNIFWIEKIKDAIVNDGIHPFYQPIINNKTNKIEKYECLVRIIDKNSIVHTPIKFLEISKKSRTYAAITKSVIEKAFKEFEDTNYEFSINLSSADMIDAEISQYIYAKLENFNGCERVVFELLESEGIENYNDVYTFIKKVKNFGCQIAIDDFGSGYSNFIHLLKLKVDIIKIDGSLIRDLDSDKSAQIIVKTIVDFAKKLDILTVAEFVHLDKINNIVKEFGIDYSQGYYLGEPKQNIC